jgi:hypothetical protein
LCKIVAEEKQGVSFQRDESTKGVALYELDQRPDPTKVNRFYGKRWSLR